MTDELKEVCQIIWQIPEIDQIQPIPLPEGKIRRVEKLVEILLISLHNYKDLLSSPFVYEVSKWAKKGWNWTKFSNIPFSLPSLRDILNKERRRDREKKRRKRDLKKLVPLILSPPKFSQTLKFKVKRNEEGVFFTTTTCFFAGNSLKFVLERFARFILSETMKGNFVPEFEIPEELISVSEDFSKSETFTEGLALISSLPPFVVIFIKVPEGYPNKEEAKFEFLSEEERKEVRVLRLNGEKFWVLTFGWEDWGEKIDFEEVYGKLRELTRYFKKRWLGDFEQFGCEKRGNELTDLN